MLWKEYQYSSDLRGALTTMSYVHFVCIKEYNDASLTMRKNQMISYRKYQSRIRWIKTQTMLIDDLKQQQQQKIMRREWIEFFYR